MLKNMIRCFIITLLLCNVAFASYETDKLMEDLKVNYVNQKYYDALKSFDKVIKSIGKAKYSSSKIDRTDANWYYRAEAYNIAGLSYYHISKIEKNSDRSMKFHEKALEYLGIACDYGYEDAASNLYRVRIDGGINYGIRQLRNR